MTTGLSQFIVVLLLLFVLVGSGVLMWDGLATGGFGHGRGAALHPHEHAKARLAVGVFGLAVAVWILLGMLSHAH
jgi:hypothetical protein